MDSTDYRSAASLDQDLSELSRTAGHSGMAQAVMRDLSDERKKLSRSLDIDPISASRTPSANREPPLKTRYEEHSFACESCRMAARRLFVFAGASVSLRRDSPQSVLPYGTSRYSKHRNVFFLISHKSEAN